MKTKNYLMILVVTLCSLVLCSCTDYGEMMTPSDSNRVTLPELPHIENMHSYKAPLYWSIYEHMKTGDAEGRGPDECVYTLEQWIEVLDWMQRELLPFGYDMVCTDGSGTFRAEDGSPYMTHQSSLDFKEFVQAAHARGIRVGIYDNPMWVHCGEDVLIPGTEYTAGSLIYDPDSDEYVVHPGHKDIWHVWALATHAGAREWIDGFFKYYHEIGVDMIRMDFLNWYEDGYSRLEQDYCGPGYGRVNYAKAISWCAESANKYGIFLSLVMPNLYNDAEIEAEYSNMFRIVSDTWDGTWSFTSGYERGRSWENWPNCRNQFDGFTKWSHLAGKGKVILDGDFTRLNTYASDAEKEFAISIQLMAGGPIAASDRPTTMGDNIRFYTNTEMLALNADRFVGHPLDDALNSPGSNIWYGDMTDGSHIIGFFNREDVEQEFSLKFSELGFSGEYDVRDLWKHADEGRASELHPIVPAHGCKIVKLTNGATVEAPDKIYVLGSNVEVNELSPNWEPKNPTAVVDVVNGEATLVITSLADEPVQLNVYTASPQECTAAGDDAMWGLVNETSIVPISMEKSQFGAVQGLKDNAYLTIPYAGIWTVKYTDGITKAVVTYEKFVPEGTPEKIYLLGSNVDVNGMKTNWDPKNPSAVVDVHDGEATLVIKYEGTDPVSLNVYTATPEQIETAENDGTLWDGEVGPISTTSIVPLSMESPEWGKVQDLKNKCYLTIPYAGIWTIKYTDFITKAIVGYKKLVPADAPKKIYLLGSDVDVNGMKTNWDPKNPTAVVDVVDGEATLVITTTKNELLNVYTATPEQIEAADKDGTLWNNKVGPIGTTSVVPLSMESADFGKLQDLKAGCYLEIPYAGKWTIQYTDGVTKAMVTYENN